MPVMALRADTLPPLMTLLISRATMLPLALVFNLITINEHFLSDRRHDSSHAAEQELEDDSCFLLLV